MPSVHAYMSVLSINSTSAEILLQRSPADGTARQRGEKCVWNSLGQVLSWQRSLPRLPFKSQHTWLIIPVMSRSGAFSRYWFRVLSFFDFHFRYLTSRWWIGDLQLHYVLLRSYFLNWCLSVLTKSAVYRLSCPFTVWKIWDSWSFKGKSDFLFRYLFPCMM